MSVLLQVVVTVFIAGCIGGLVSGLFMLDKTLERKKQLFIYRGEMCGVYFPGLFGNTLLGGVAALVFWSLYGPYSGVTVIGTSITDVGLTVGQLAICLIIGMGGAGFLTTEARRRCCQSMGE